MQKFLLFALMSLVMANQMIFPQYENSDFELSPLAAKLSGIQMALNLGAFQDMGMIFVL